MSPECWPKTPPERNLACFVLAPAEDEEGGDEDLELILSRRGVECVVEVWKGRVEGKERECGEKM